MKQMQDIHDHDHADTLMDDYVMGTLSDADQAWMDAHIVTCLVCQREIPALIEGTHALALSPDDPPMGMADDLWDRIAQSLEPGAATQAAPPSTVAAADDPFAGGEDVIPLDFGPAPGAKGGRRVRSAPTGTGGWGNQSGYRWLAVAALVVIVVTAGALIGRSLWWADDEDVPQEIALHDAEGNLIGQEVANLEYMPDQQRFVLHMDDMPAAPEGQVYQAWLIAGDVPTPMGIVDPTDGEFEVDGDRANYDAFAITMEPGPEGSQTPTSDPIVVAPLGDTT